MEMKRKLIGNQIGSESGSETEIIQKLIVMIDFFVFRKNHRKVVSMIKFIKKRIRN